MANFFNTNTFINKNPLTTPDTINDDLKFLQEAYRVSQEREGVLGKAQEVILGLDAQGNEIAQQHLTNTQKELEDLYKNDFTDGFKYKQLQAKLRSIATDPMFKTIGKNSAEIERYNALIAANPNKYGPDERFQIQQQINAYKNFDGDISKLPQLQNLIPYETVDTSQATIDLAKATPASPITYTKLLVDPNGLGYHQKEKTTGNLHNIQLLSELEAAKTPAEQNAVFAKDKAAYANFIKSSSSPEVYGQLERSFARHIAENPFSPVNNMDDFIHEKIGKVAIAMSKSGIQEVTTSLDEQSAAYANYNIVEARDKRARNRELADRTHRENREDFIYNRNLKDSQEAARLKAQDEAAAGSGGGQGGAITDTPFVAAMPDAQINIKGQPTNSLKQLYDKAQAELIKAQEDFKNAPINSDQQSTASLAITAANSKVITIGKTLAERRTKLAAETIEILDNNWSSNPFYKTSVYKDKQEFVDDMLNAEGDATKTKAWQSVNDEIKSNTFSTGIYATSNISNSRTKLLEIENIVDNVTFNANKISNKEERINTFIPYKFNPKYMGDGGSKTNPFYDNYESFKESLVKSPQQLTTVGDDRNYGSLLDERYQTVYDKITGTKRTDKVNFEVHLSDKLDDDLSMVYIIDNSLPDGSSYRDVVKTQSSTGPTFVRSKINELRKTSDPESRNLANRWESQLRFNTHISTEELKSINSSGDFFIKPQEGRFPMLVTIRNMNPDKVDVPLEERRFQISNIRIPVGNDKSYDFPLNYEAIGEVGLKLKLNEIYNTPSLFIIEDN